MNYIWCECALHVTQQFESKENARMLRCCMHTRCTQTTVYTYVCNESVCLVDVIAIIVAVIAVVAITIILSFWAWFCGCYANAVFFPLLSFSLTKIARTHTRYIDSNDTTIDYNNNNNNKMCVSIALQRYRYVLNENQICMSQSLGNVNVSYALHM